MLAYGRLLKANVLPVYGGQPYAPQISQLKRGVDIVVGTPGRLMDLMERKVLDLSDVKTVVLDEADEMLNMGFIEAVEAILAATPDRTADRPLQRDPADTHPRPRRTASCATRKRFPLNATTMTVQATEQRYYLVHELDKLNALTNLFEMESDHQRAGLRPHTRRDDAPRQRTVRARLPRRGAQRRPRTERPRTHPGTLPLEHAQGARRHRRGRARPGH